MQADSYLQDVLCIDMCECVHDIADESDILCGCAITCPVTYTPCQASKLVLLLLPCFNLGHKTSLHQHGELHELLRWIMQVVLVVNVASK